MTTNDTRSSTDLEPTADNWLQAYRAADAQEKHWAEVKKNARARLEEQLGNAEEGRLNGRTVIRNTEVLTNRLDTTKLKENEPEVYDRYLKPSISRRFTVVPA